MLIRREGHPFIGKLVLPGGLANENESVEETASRELEGETGVKDVPMKLVDIFSEPGRDPRGWIVSAAFAMVVDAKNIHVQAGDDASEALWYEVKTTDNGFCLWRNDASVEVSDLAFDHEKILRKALETIGSEYKV